MKLLQDGETAVLECSGRTLEIFEGIIGLSLDGGRLVTAGHDCYPMIVMRNVVYDMTLEEQEELADHMIAEWKKYKEGLRGEEGQHVGRDARGGDGRTE